MKSLIFFLLLFFSIISNAQTPTYVQTFGSTNIEQIGGLQANSQHEIFVAGTYGDDMTIGNNNLLINGLEDIFLCKKDGNGQTIWTKTFGSNDRDKITGFRLYNDTSLYFSGIFWDNITFDNFSLSANGSSVFIAKSDTLANIIWAKAIDGSGLLNVNEGITDSQGNYIITGSFSNDLFFPNTTLTAEGIEDGFIAKYDENGNFLWANRFGFQQQTIATSVTTDGLNNVYVAGQFNGRVIFGNDTLWAAANDFDIFLAQYDDNGIFQYGKRFGGIFDDTNPKLGIGTFGKIVMAGTFIGLLNLDAQTVIQTNSNIDSDIFLLTLDQTGNLLTSNQYGDITNETLVNLTVNFDDYYLSGFFNTSTKIGNVTLTTSFANLQNLLIRTSHLDLNKQPNVISYGSTQPSSTNFVVPLGVPIDDAIIAGTFQGAISVPVATPSPVSNGFTDVFVVGLTFPPVSTSTISDDFNINIFPNPATDFVNIEVNDLIIHSPIIIEVINTVGQVKQRLSIDNNNQIQVPVYHLPKGIYFLRMEIDGKIVVRKFMKN